MKHNGLLREIIWPIVTEVTNGKHDLAPELRVQLLLEIIKLVSEAMKTISRMYRIKKKYRKRKPRKGPKVDLPSEEESDISLDDTSKRAPPSIFEKVPPSRARASSYV